MHHGAGAVLQPVGQLGRQVEVLAAGAERGRSQDQVPHPPLVALVQPLVDLVHAAEGDGGELLQGELQVVMLIRGDAAKFGLISITYHKYILGVHKYILRLEISTFDRENH